MRTNTAHAGGSTASSTTLHRPGRSAAVATTALLTLALTGCGAEHPAGTSNEGWTESSQAADAGASPVLLLGDSVAAGEAVALRQGLAESGVTFVDATSIGGGNLVGPNAEAQWKALPQTLERAENGVVIYQITTFDWGTPEEQRAAYERLADATARVGADLLLASMPPIRPDDFYEPHVTELATAADAARRVADDHDGVGYLDTAQVWGDTYAREHDGAIDRSDDGVHVCPQGAARFTSWLLGQLAARYAGFTPAPPASWANSGWADSDLFVGC